MWNGIAEDLAIAVFGESFEEARAHMLEAIVCHLESLQEAGELASTVEQLRQRARDRYLSVNEMARNESLVRLSATVQDERISALV